MNDVAACIGDMFQLGAFLETRPHSSVRVISPEPDVLCGARKAGHPVTDLWEFSSEAERMEVEDEAWALLEFIGGALAGKYTMHGVDLLQLMKNELIFPVSESLHLARMFRSCLAATGAPREVHALTTLSEAWFWDPFESRSSDVFNGAVLHFFEGLGIPVVPIQPSVLPMQKREFVRWGERGEASGTFAPPLTQKCRLLSVCLAYDFVEQRALIDHLVQHGRRDCLFITDESFTEPLPHMLVRRLLRLPFSGIPEVKNIAVEFRTAGERQGRFREVLANPHLAFVWNHFERHLGQAGRWYGLGRLLGREIQPSAALVGYDVFGHTRCLAQGLLDEGVRVLSMDHAGCGLPVAHRRHTGGTAALGVWGAYDREGTARWRSPTAGAIITGTLRKNIQHLVEVADPNGSGKPPVIVFVTGLIAFGLAECWGSPYRLQATWRGLLELVASRPTWKFILKTHPRYDYPGMFDALDLSRHANLEVVRGASLGEVLARADGAVLVNYFSDVAVEVARSGRPVFLLADALFQREALTRAMPEGFACESVEALDLALNGTFPNDRIKAGVTQVMKSWAGQMLEAEGAEAVRRVFDVLVYDGAGVEPMVPGRFSWLLQSCAAVDGLLSGELPQADADRFFSSIRTSAAPDHGLLLNEFVGRFLLEVAIWDYGRKPGIAMHRFLVHRLHKLIPGEYRPGFRIFRRCLTIALREDRSQGLSPLNKALNILLGLALAGPAYLQTTPVRTAA